MRAWFQVGARHPGITLAAVAVLGAIGAFLVAASGLIPIRASSGHWPFTVWLLEFGMQRSVSVHSRFAPDPPPTLDDPREIVRGAGHFETGCRPCHGAPGFPVPRIPRAMTPAPPPLAEAVPLWDARELFYIVKHGLKLTGMPAWPALTRDDEVWSVVAFIRRLPHMKAAEYERMVRGGGQLLTELEAGAMGATSPPETVRDVCLRCHGADGLGRGGAFPKLAGQSLEYLRQTMTAYAEGRRHSGIMEPIAAGLTAAAVDASLRYYAALPPWGTARPQDAGVREPEARAALREIEDEIPICTDCHARTGRRVLDAYPRVTGQWSNYIMQQLRLMKQRRRGGTGYVEIMHSVVDRLDDRQMDELARLLGDPPQSPR